MESANVSLFIAFVAGVLSFLSPCVLPLIPSYLSYITGLAFDQLTSAEDRFRVRRITLVHSGLFILGFSAVFILLGASATVLGQQVIRFQEIMQRVGGGVIIVLGLYLTGLLRLPWLGQERKLHLRTRPAGYLGSVVIGVTFAAGWTPCVGPILGSILVMAGTAEHLSRGVALLIAYSLGLGIPFILAGLAINAFLAGFARIRRALHAIEILSGLLLIVVGLALLTDYFTTLTAWLNQVLYPLTRWLNI